MTNQHPTAEPVHAVSSDQVATNLERGIGAPLASLVPDWISVEQAAEQLGVAASRVKLLARDHELAVAGRRGGWVPAVFIDGSSILKGLAGTLTLLFDARYDPVESITWLFTPDDSLPGRPVDALCENRGTEVRRRAQALGF